MMAPLLAAVLAAVAGDAAAAPHPTPARTPSDPAPAGRGDERAPDKKPVPPAGVLEDVVGTVTKVDRLQHRITVETSSGPAELQLDRNTLVYVARGLGTVLDVEPGVRVRAGRNADDLAYWVAVQAPPQERPTSTAAGSDVTQRAAPPAGQAPAGGPGGPGTAAPPGPGAVTPGPPVTPGAGPTGTR